jgi:hypothetical protein
MGVYFGNLCVSIRQSYSKVINYFLISEIFIKVDYIYSDTCSCKE